MRGCEGRQYGWSVMAGGADRVCRGCRWARRPRSPWTILACAARSFDSPNILLQRRTHFEQGRMQPMQEAPAAIGDNGGFWYAVRMCPRRLRRGAFVWGVIRSLPAHMGHYVVFGHGEYVGLVGVVIAGIPIGIPSLYIVEPLPGRRLGLCPLCPCFVLVGVPYPLSPVSGSHFWQRHLMPSFTRKQKLEAKNS